MSEEDPSNRIRALHAAARRLRRWTVLGALLGIVVGALVALLSWIVVDVMLVRILGSDNVWLFLFAPVVGMVVATLLVRYTVRDRSSATTDAFLTNFHTPGKYLDWRNLPGKMLASIFTVGSGMSMGYEGPPIFLGSTLGATLQKRFSSWFNHDADKVMSVAGAAAGLAAIFRAPLTGVLYALEGPYLADMVRFAVVPAMAAAATSYTTMVALRGADVLFPIKRFPVPDLEMVLEQIGVAVVLGVVCALLMLAFVPFVHALGRLFAKTPRWATVVGAGLTIGGLGIASYLLTGRPLAIGEGIPATTLFLNGEGGSASTIAALVVMMAIGLGTSIKAGGVGGEFFPLSMIGAGIGAVVQGIAPHADPTLFPILGIAGVFAAAFRAPLTAAVFIAETTGSIVYLVPGLIAAVTANAMMGRHSLLSVQVLHPYARSVIVSRTPIGDLLASLPTPQSFAAETSLDTCAQQLVDPAAYVVANGEVVGVVTRSALLRIPLTDYPARKIADIEDTSPLRLDASTQRDVAVTSLAEDKKHDAILVERDGQPVGLLVEADLVRGE